MMHSKFQVIFSNRSFIPIGRWKTNTISPELIAEVLGVGRRCIYDWRRWYRVEGEAGLCQKPRGPPGVGDERLEQSSPLGQVRKRWAIVPGEPAIKGPVADPFQGVQDPRRHHLAGPQACLGVFRERAHLVIDPIEQVRDKVNCGHGDSPFVVNLGSLYRHGDSHGRFNLPEKNQHHLANIDFYRLF